MNQCAFNPLHCKNLDVASSSEVPKYNEHNKIFTQLLNKMKDAALNSEEGQTVRMALLFSLRCYF